MLWSYVSLTGEDYQLGDVSVYIDCHMPIYDLINPDQSLLSAMLTQ